MKKLPLLFLLVLLTACQSDGNGPSALAPLESARVTEAKTPEPTVATPAPPPAAQPATATPPQPSTPQQSAEVRMREAVIRVAQIQKNRGTLAALDAVFACYKPVESPKASVDDAKVCAAQDFVISRSVNEGKAKSQGRETDNRARLIAKRSAPRIGALMQLKGMNQAQFNNFGNFLHRVILPVYEGEAS